MKLTVATHEAGYVVITDDAILSILSKSQLEAGAPAIGGAIAGAIGRTMERKKAEQVAPATLPAKLGDLQRVEVCKYSDLPRTLVSAQGFPRVEGFRSVTIFPKRVVQSVKASVWRGVVMTINNQAHPLAVQMWQIGKLKRHLAEAGYRLM